MARIPRILLAGLSVLVCPAAPAQAATYALDFGPTLTGQLTTSDLTVGGGHTVTSVTGAFMGEAITGVVSDPYTPDPGHYIVRNGNVRATDPPGTTTVEYIFDDLLFPDNTFDENGLLFTTATRAVDLFYYQGSFYADFSARRTNDLYDEVELTGRVRSLPEPAAWMLMIVGFGLAGSAMRWRAPARSLA